MTPFCSKIQRSRNLDFKLDGSSLHMEALVGEYNEKIFAT